MIKDYDDKESIDLINKVLRELPNEMSAELMVNLIANMIVTYGLFDKIAEIQFGTIMVASEIVEDMEAHTIH